MAGRTKTRPVETATPKRCTAGAAAIVYGGDISLPVAGISGGEKIRRSRMGPRRAAVLIGVHLLIVGHAIHYAVAGRTLSPVEPSESMFTLEEGALNAGFIFFATALASVLLVGRFFCGWGCHIVAYQDLCAWFMKKLRVKPRPLRSRLLVFVPLGAALYMFVYPSVMRMLMPEQMGPFPGFNNHVMTDSFWKTFPGPVFAVLTIAVCGFAAVYFLGAKGFCTYGCPYGGFFAVLDRVSVGRILVSDACEQCGHCTAVCTSNVRVHEEVHRYGMVVDPGCMKCMDCVSVCPNNALRFGFASPVINRAAPVRQRGAPRTSTSTDSTTNSASAVSKKYDFTWAEEIALALVFLISMLAFRGLYDGPPFLMSIGLGGITAFIALKTWRMLRDPTVRIQNWRIKTAGALGWGGHAFAALATAWLGFAGHSAFVRWHQAWGRHYFNQTEAAESDVFSPSASPPKQYSDRHNAAVAAGFRHLTLADRWGLADTLEVERGLVWLNLVRGDNDAAEQHARAAIEKVSDAPGLLEDLAKIQAMRGRYADAIATHEKIMSLRTPTAMDHFRLADLYINANQPDRAVEQYKSSIAANPEHGPAYYNLGGLLGRMGQFAEAIKYLERARQLMPEDADTAVELGIAYASDGRIDEAMTSFNRAIELDPQNPMPRMQLDYLKRNVRPGSGNPDGSSPR